MLNIGGLNEGFVLDHIEAGKAMMIYNNLDRKSTRLNSSHSV